jgi:hypothetical protein
MKTKSKKPLQDLLKTENEHWNEFAYQLHCKATEKGLFADAIQPLQLVDAGTTILAKQAENPAKGVELLLSEMANAVLTIPQQLFIYNGVNEYLTITEFEGQVLTQAKDLLLSHCKRLRKENEPVKPLVKNIREMLKAQVQKELEQLPETLKDMEPDKRLSIVCKLIPFVLPKVEAINAERGEPGDWIL